MNDLRKEIERQFKAHGLIDDQAENKASDASPEKVAPSEPPISPIEETAVVQVLLAPESYQEKFASDFKNLPHEWQVFLIEHENQNNEKYKQASDSLQAYKTLEVMYDNNRLRLEEQGFNKIQDWLEGLVWVDQELARRPEQTIRAIAQVYGVKPDGKEHKSEAISAQTVARLSNLEKNFHEMASYLNSLQIRRLDDLLQMFARQTDADGNALHPYFESVKDQVRGLLASGTLQSVEDAYESALWLNPQIRAELIAKQISSQAAEAQQAQKAAFAPKGKSEAPERPLTLREELEKNMAAFMD